jgi:GxxExxY protein
MHINFFNTKVTKEHKGMQKNIKPIQFKPILPEVERVGKIVLDSAFKVHSDLGPGLLESVCETCLAYEIRKRDISVGTQSVFPIVYRDVRIESGLRLDMVVDDCVIVEIKAVERWNAIYEAQLLTYLKLSKIRLGFLINFNVLHLKDGIRRMVC